MTTEDSDSSGVEDAEEGRSSRHAVRRTPSRQRYGRRQEGGEIKTSRWTTVKGKRRRKKDKLHIDEVGYDGGGDKRRRSDRARGYRASHDEVTCSHLFD